MAQHVNVSKAAHLLGISRHELQRMIREGALHAFEGQLDLEELKGRFPALALEESAIIERVKMIRQSAFARRVRETVMPEQGELESRLQRRTSEWAVEKATAEKYRGLLEEIAARLAQMQQRCTAEELPPILELNRWLVERLRE